MTRGRYTTVKIPFELAQLLDNSCKHLGYRSRAEVVDDAIRMFIVSVKRFEESKKNQEPRLLLTAHSK